MRIKATECGSANEAIQKAKAGRQGEAILVAGRFLVVEQAEADQLGRAGVEFAYLFNHFMEDGSCRLLTVPVN